MRYMRLAGQLSSAHDTLSKQEFLALSVLDVNGPSRMGEIAEHLGVVQSAITPLVDRLEEQDLVRRSRSESDRRAWLVELTSAGTETVASENKLFEGVATEILEPLSDAERETLTALFEQMATASTAGT